MGNSAALLCLPCLHTHQYGALGWTGRGGTCTNTETEEHKEDEYVINNPLSYLTEHINIPELKRVTFEQCLSLCWPVFFKLPGKVK